LGGRIQMVDVRQKGATAESKARDELRAATGLQWERVPGSGALDAKHGLKGDLYVPNEKNLYAVECKHYKESHIDHSLLTGKTPQVIEWWEQAVRQGIQVDKKPLLIFKHDRSKFFAAFQDMPAADYRYLFVSTHGHEFYIALLSDYLTHNKPKFI
jgi:hypothetical protein